MVDMSSQDMKAFAESMAGKIPDPNADADDCENESDLYNRPSEGMVGDPRDRKPAFDLYKVDFKWVAN